MGYIRGGRLVILSPQQKVKMYRPDYKTGVNTRIYDSANLINEAIAWYQGASFQYKSGKYKSIK